MEKVHKWDLSLCIVCDKQIDDSVEESILCEGECEGWIHRICAGLSKKAFKLAQESSLPFLGHYCSSTAQTNEIKALKEEVSLLQAKLAAAKTIENSPVTQNASLQQSQSYASVAQRSHDNTPSSLIHPRASTTSVPQDRKFNIIVYGVKEGLQQAST